MLNRPPNGNASSVATRLGWAVCGFVIGAPFGFGFGFQYGLHCGIGLGVLFGIVVAIDGARLEEGVLAYVVEFFLHP